MLAAKAVIEAGYLSKGDDPTKPHTVYLGQKIENGHETGEPAVVVVVSEKLPKARALECGYSVVPETLFINGEIVKIDVVEAPPPEVAIARLPDWRTSTQNDWQRCHACPIPGGVQIAPRGAQWVGTLGGAFTFPRADGSTAYGALTNYHVAHGGEFPAGTLILQPHGQSDPSKWFAKLDRWVPIKFESGNNLVDLALLDCRRTDGLYAPATDTVKAEQLQIGPINPIPHTSQQVGDLVQKSGRTTFRTQGKVVGVEATSYVDYGPEGTAKFVRQIVIESPSGNFSAGGDSGSLILTTDNRPVGLLFAGGGRQTIANPIQFVLEAVPGSKFRSN